MLDNVEGQEAYSFNNGFSSYHQIKIAPEDKIKTTYVIERGIFQYTIISFGLNITPLIFSYVVIPVFKEFVHKFSEV